MPESVGRILKRIRESKRFSLEEVSERSRISKNIVIAIEEDRLSEIKSGFYAKSFVKTYAVFLGALNEPVVKEYLAAGQKKQETASSPLSARHSVKTNRKKTSPASKIPQIDFSAIAKYKRQVLAVIIVISILGVLSLAIGQAGKFIKNIPAKKQSKASVIKKEAPKNKKAEKEKPKDAARDVKKDLLIKKSDAIEIEVSASDNTWLQVTIDGETVFVGLFKKGGKDTWKAKKEIKLEAGNSGVVKISINGKPAGFSGKKGEKKEITITKDGIR